jgi:hypothetical protein
MPTVKELKNYKGRKTLPDLKLTQEKNCEKREEMRFAILSLLACFARG